MVTHSGRITLPSWQTVKTFIMRRFRWICFLLAIIVVTGGATYFILNAPPPRSYAVMVNARYGLLGSNHNPNVGELRFKVSPIHIDPSTTDTYQIVQEFPTKEEALRQLPLIAADAEARYRMGAGDPTPFPGIRSLVILVDDKPVGVIGELHYKIE